MESKFIENIFKDYISTPDTNHALLINGTWGSGKTYFWKNKLSQLCYEVEPKLKPIYLSLNGLNKTETLDYQLKIKLIPFLQKLDVKKGASIGKLSKNAFFQFIKGRYNVDAESILKDVEIDLTNFSNKIICFDDLERCKIPLSEVLGFVNNFVEHKNLKVVFLSDESKIDDSNGNSYNSIKEKVIGRVLNYKNNLSDTLPLLFEKYKNTNSDFYTFLHEKNKFIRDLLVEYREENLRNISFSLDILSKIYTTSRTHKNYIDEVLLFVLIISIEFKTGKLNSNNFEDFKGYNDINTTLAFFNFSKPEIDPYSYSNDEEKSEKPISDLERFHQKYLTNNIEKYFFYTSIYQFILTGYFDEEKFSNELKSRYPIEISKEVSGFRKLLNYNFRYLPNDKFLLLFNEVFQYAKEGKYSIYDYLQISDFFNFFSTNKLVDVSITDIQNALSNGINIAKLREEGDERLFYSIFRSRVTEGDNLITDLITNSHNAIIEKKETQKVNKLIQALLENNGEMVIEVFKKYQVQKELFEFLDPTQLFNTLESIKNETFTEFNYEMDRRYQAVNVRDFLNEDFDFLIELNSFITNKLKDKNNFQVQDFLFKELETMLNGICRKLNPAFYDKKLN